MTDRMIAYCGLDCLKCDAYAATQSGDSNRLAQVAEEWSAKFKVNVQPEHVICDGCKSGRRKSYHCKNTCKIRICCLKKAIDSCGKCDMFPCSDEEFVLKNSPEAEKNLKVAKGLVPA